MAPKALAGLVGIALAAAAAAYAAAAPQGGAIESGKSLGRVVRGPGRGSPDRRAMAPVILSHPPAVDASATASFRFRASTTGGRSQCKLDRAGWASCRSRVTYGSIVIGRHTFRVRTLLSPSAPGSTSRYAWLRVEPQAFTVVPLFSGLDALYPGAAPVALPLEVKNPNPIAIVVTRLSVAVAEDPHGCDSASNLELAQSNVSSSLPLPIAAGGVAQVPSPGILAPTIRLRNLPVDQDACQRAQFPLEFSGSAHG